MHKSENHYLIGDKIQVTFIPQYMEFYLFPPFSHNQSLQEKSLGKEYFPIYSSGNHFSGIEKAVPYGPHLSKDVLHCLAVSHSLTSNSLSISPLLSSDFYGIYNLYVRNDFPVQGINFEHSLQDQDLSQYHVSNNHPECC